MLHLDNKIIKVYFIVLSLFFFSYEEKVIKLFKLFVDD